MPVNRAAFNSARQTAPAVEQTGDPFFQAGKYDVTAQYPSEAAAANLESNKSGAQQKVALLTQLGLDVPDDLMETAQQGYIKPKPSLFDRALAILDNPRRTVNLAMQDIAGGKAKPGYDDPDFGDYLKTLFTTDKPREVAAKTGLNPISGAATLGLLGWEEADTIGGKIGRGVASFALEVLTDPLTYVTFGASALGKKVLAATGEGLVNNMTKAVSKYATSGTLRGLEVGSKFAEGTSAAKRLTSLVDEVAVKYLDPKLWWRRLVGMVRWLPPVLMLCLRLSAR